MELEKFKDFGNLKSNFQWIHVPGKLKWISSGRGVVVGVNSGNNIYYRKGLSAGRPTGTGWVHIPGKLMMIEIYGDQVVGTNPGHAIFKCPVTGVPSTRGRGGKGGRTGNPNSLTSSEGKAITHRLFSHKLFFVRHIMESFCYIDWFTVLCVVLIIADLVIESIENINYLRIFVWSLKVLICKGN